MGIKPPLDQFSNTNAIKFLCSYGGKIVPRYPDGKLRYNGGHTRVLSVTRSISFSELLMKMEELCNTKSITIRCQLPKEDLDALITIKSNEDLLNLFEEYDRFSVASSSVSIKIRAFLLPLKSVSISPSSSTSPKTLSPNSLSPSSSFNFSGGGNSPRFTAPPPPVLVYPRKTSHGCQYCCRNLNRVYLVHHGYKWQ